MSISSTLKFAGAWLKVGNGTSNIKSFDSKTCISYAFRSRIRTALSTKLNESGWSDDAHHRSKGEKKKIKYMSFLLLLTWLCTSRSSKNYGAPSVLHSPLRDFTPHSKSVFPALNQVGLLKRQFLASIPLAVKREISNLIRQHVEKQFE